MTRVIGHGKVFFLIFVTQYVYTSVNWQRVSNKVNSKRIWVAKDQARQSYAADFAPVLQPGSYFKLTPFLCLYICQDIMRYRVIYFQCLCYLALPLCIVSMHLTRCALWHVLCLFPLFFKFLVFEAAIYANKDAYRPICNCPQFIRVVILWF